MQKLMLVLGLLLLGADVAAASEPPALADFFRNPTVTRLVMSPNGQHLPRPSPAGRRGGGDWWR